MMFSFLKLISLLRTHLSLTIHVRMHSKTGLATTSKLIHRLAELPKSEFYYFIYTIINKIKKIIHAHNKKYPFRK
jgi:hypothetical protein